MNWLAGLNPRSYWLFKVSQFFEAVILIKKAAQGHQP
jgi:hypothetical protein